MHGNKYEMVARNFGKNSPYTYTIASRWLNFEHDSFRHINLLVAKFSFRLYIYS